MYGETTETTCKNNFYAAQQARGFESAARFRGEKRKCGHVSPHTMKKLFPMLFMLFSIELTGKPCRTCRACRGKQQKQLVKTTSTPRNTRGDSRAPRGFAAKRTKSNFFGIICGASSMTTYDN